MYMCIRGTQKFLFVNHSSCTCISGAPYSYRKEKETNELIFPWLSWLAVLLVGAYAQRRWRPGGRGQLCLRSYAIARPMILTIITSLVSRPVKFQWPPKGDTRKVLHLMIAKRI